MTFKIFSFYTPTGPILPALLVWFSNLRTIPFRLARRYMARCLMKNDGLYIAYHANVAVRLHDLQHNRCFKLDDNGVEVEINYATEGWGNFDFNNLAHRSAVSQDLLQLVFDLQLNRMSTAYPPKNAKPERHWRLDEPNLM